jgi:Tfp pilus assembly protein PilO
MRPERLHPKIARKTAMAATEWTERKKMLLTVAVGVVLIGAAGFYLYSLNGDWKKKADEDVKLQAEIRSLQDVVKDRPMKASELEKKKAEFATKESKLPDQDRVKELINDVFRLAANNNCELISNSIGEPIYDSTKNYIKDIWKTRWKADYFSWCKLLNEMEERFPRFVAFENMSFTILNSGMIPTGAKHDILVDVITYRYKEKKLGDTPN